MENSLLKIEIIFRVINLRVPWVLTTKGPSPFPYSPCRQEIYGEIQGCGWFGQSGSGVVRRVRGPEPHCTEQQ